MSEIVWTGFVAAAGSSAVQLSPVQNSGVVATRPDLLRINQITVSTQDSTPPVGFWGAAGACHVFEVIIRRKG